MNEETHLYQIDIQHIASPAEIASFCDLLEENGYEVGTDLSAGRIDIHSGGGER